MQIDLSSVSLFSGHRQELAFELDFSNPDPTSLRITYPGVVAQVRLTWDNESPGQLIELTDLLADDERTWGNGIVAVASIVPGGGGQRGLYAAAVLLVDHLVKIGV